MLTPPKWHAAWLKSQYYAVNASNKTVYLKPSDRMFDDLSKCCNSHSKELTLEALKCWRIWIDNQQFDDWKQNEICYSAVQPLLTKKFHSLHKDVEVSEMKLNLMWLTIQKTQHLIHLEGPQHILEVFIQSCTSWLSCFEENDSHFQDLILKLLSNLFSMEVKIAERDEKFPSLNCEILKSNRVFCRLVNNFIEIFVNWAKIKDKTELLNIWNHFLDHCERCFKYIPITIWHNIFKLADNVCADEKEPMKNKIAMLHKCATSLKSVMSNSKFIDCSQFLTTPAEAMLKILTELCMNCRDENIDFEIFLNCQEICYTLCNRTLDTVDHEFCLHLLGKIESIEVKPLLWALWCGLTKHFNERLNIITLEHFNKTEMRLFRKLRATAMNFDLDKPFLEEKSLPLIETCFKFLRINSICANCLGTNNSVEQNVSKNNLLMELNDCMIEDSWNDFHGNFNSNLISHLDITICDFSSNKNKENFITSQSSKHYRLKKNVILKRILTINESFSTLVPLNLTPLKELLEIPEYEYSQRKDIWRNLYLQHNFSLMHNTFRIFKPFVINFESPGCSKFSAPLYIKVALETLSTQLKFNILLDKSITGNVKSTHHKIRQEQLFPLRKLIYSYGEQENTKLFKDLLEFREKIKLFHDIDFDENLNYSCMKSGSLPLIFIILFMIMCINHKSANNNEEVIVDRIKWLQEKELLLLVRVATLAKSIINCRGNDKKYGLPERVCKFWPINKENIMAKDNFVKIPCKMNNCEEDSYCNHNMILSDKPYNRTLSDDLNILQNVDELENKNDSNAANLTKKIKDNYIREKTVHNPRTFRRREENGITKYFLRRKNLNMSNSSKGFSSNKEVDNWRTKTKNSKELIKEKTNASLDKNRVNRNQIDSIFKDTGKKKSKSKMCENVRKKCTEFSTFDGTQHKSKIQSKKPKLQRDNHKVFELRKTNKKKKSNKNSNKKRNNITEKNEQIESQKSVALGQKVTQDKSSCSTQNETLKDKSFRLRQRPLPRPSKFECTQWPCGSGKIKRKNFVKNVEFNPSETNANNIENQNSQNVGINVSKQDKSQNTDFVEISFIRDTESFIINRLPKTPNDINSLDENRFFENSDFDLDYTNISEQNSDLEYSENMELCAVDEEKFKVTNAENQEKFNICELFQADENKKRRKNLKRKNCTNIDNLRKFSDFEIDSHVDEEVVEVVNAIISNIENCDIETSRFQNHLDQNEKLYETMNNTLIESFKCEDSPESSQFLCISSCFSLVDSDIDSLNGDNFAQNRINILDDTSNEINLKIKEIYSATELNSAISNIDKTEESFLGENSGKQVASNMTENAHKFSESVDEELSTRAVKLSMQKSESNLIHNRGSRMLALISDSAKIEHFHDSSPSSKQTKKPPNVNKSSRASKMLALLPELQQENTSNFECNLVEEVILEKFKDTSDERNRLSSGRTYLPNTKIASSTVIDSPKLCQPLLQRKSIRFDDEKNETVTYFTDSPPCQIVKKRMNLRRSEKNFEYSK